MGFSFACAAADDHGYCFSVPVPVQNNQPQWPLERVFENHNCARAGCHTCLTRNDIGFVGCAFSGPKLDAHPFLVVCGYRIEIGFCQST